MIVVIPAFASLYYFAIFVRNARVFARGGISFEGATNIVLRRLDKGCRTLNVQERVL